MEKNINSNGYDYVDLGLPSGTLWASCNVGANKPTDYGLYFQWGDTQGYTKEQVGTEKRFNWTNYKFSINGSGSNFSKYTNPSAKLELEDDAAHANMGGDWHMPTHAQIQEIIDKTISDWDASGGVGGMKFTSKKDESRFIFIPMAGMAWDGLADNNEYNGNVWSSMVSTTDIYAAQSLYFDFGGPCLSNGGSRNYGLSVRGVIDKRCDSSKEEKKNMNDDLNLVEILKDAPKGTKLWSPVCGECELFDVNIIRKSFPIVCIGIGDGPKWLFKANGTFVENTGVECVLFPSKDNRDWSTFKVPEKHKHFEPYQKVLVKAYSEPSPNHKIWFPDIYLFFEEQNSCHRVAINKYIHNDDNIIPFEGNEDKVGKAIE